MSVRLGESPNQLVTGDKYPQTDQKGMESLSAEAEAGIRTDANVQKVHGKWRKCKWLVSQVLTYLEKNELKSV